MAVMSEYWLSLEGQRVDERLRLISLRSGDPHPVFHGEMTNESGDTSPVLVRLWPDIEAFGSVVNRHREAMFLNHPGLLHCLGTGAITFTGNRYVYGVYERPEVDGSELAAWLPLTPGTVAELCRELIDALRYLHEQDLVYCNLDQTTIARRHHRWVLADYSQLRTPGSNYASETRRLLAVLPGAPPEAFEGIVTPAWDSWSMGHLIRTLMLELKAPDARDHAVRPSERSVRQKGSLPEPFASIATACLAPSPEDRSTLAQIEGSLPAHTGAAFVPPAHHVHAPPPRPAIPSSTARTRRGFMEAAIVAAGVLGIVGIVAMDRRSDPREIPPPVQAEPIQSRTRTADRVEKPPIDVLLQQWAQGFRDRDLEAQMALYAPQLERYYLRSSVPVSVVRANKADAMRRLGSVREYIISNVEVSQPDRNTAVAKFDKYWEFTRGANRSGLVQSELKFEKIDGDWRIVSERDLKTYRRGR